MVRPERREKRTVLRDIDDLEIRDVAKFGKPSPGIIGALKYWLMVRKRLSELAAQYNQAEEASRQATERMHNSRAELGRKAHELGVKGREIDSLVDKAVRAQGQLIGVREQREGLEKEYKTKLGEIDEQIAKAETEAAPYRHKEIEIQRKRSKILTDHRREEARLKRAEIELRNLDELIQKRKARSADKSIPGEQRQSVFDEISRIESKRPTLVLNIQTQEKQLASFVEPLAQIDTELDEIQGQLAHMVERIESFKRQKDELDGLFSQKAEAAAHQVDGEAQKVNLAWAEVGEQILRANLQNPQLEELCKKAVGAHESAAGSKRQVELLALAQQSYDHSVVQKAKMIAAVLAVIVLAAIFVTLFFLT